MLYLCNILDSVENSSQKSKRRHQKLHYLACHQNFGSGAGLKWPGLPDQTKFDFGDHRKIGVDGELE